MPRAVWTGSLSFGLVNIGVRLFPATSPKDVRFHLVDEQGRRVRYRRYVPDELDDDAQPVESSPSATTERATDAEAPREEREVEYDELMRGYETDEGLVVLSPDEVESVRPPRSRVIDIEDFVDLADVDPVFFEKSYVLAPQRDAEKPYALLLRALEHAGRVGIGRFVLRTKPHLVAIRPADGVLGLETMFFGDEVRDGRALVQDIDESEISERELQLAQTLIDTLKTEWDPSRYADTYRDELLRRIADKEPMRTVEPRAGEAPTGRVEELMEALKASVEEAKKAKRGAKKRSA
jgi:DNA end-binding protein Ku